MNFLVCETEIFVSPGHFDMLLARSSMIQSNLVSFSYYYIIGDVCQTVEVKLTTTSYHPSIGDFFYLCIKYHTQNNSFMYPSLFLPNYRMEREYTK